MSIFGDGRPPNPRNDYSMSIFAGDDSSPRTVPTGTLVMQRTPHKCPKCDGKGWVNFEPETGRFEGAPQMWRCDVCEAGIIWSKP